jgi:hypothetical protein
MTSIDTIRHLSPHQLALLGVEDIAFVKPVAVNDEIAYSIHAADGRQIALLADRAVAFAAIRQQGLEPVSVH